MEKIDLQPGMTATIEGNVLSIKVVTDIAGEVTTSSIVLTTSVNNHLLYARSQVDEEIFKDIVTTIGDQMVQFLRIQNGMLLTIKKAPATAHETLDIMANGLDAITYNLIALTES